VNSKEARSFEQYLPILRRAIKAEMARRERVEQQISALCDLPQLFIAV
jgi:hypothetical protein